MLHRVTLESPEIVTSGFKSCLCDVETSDLRQWSVLAHLSNGNDYDNYFVQWLGGLSEIEWDPKLSMLV